MTVPADFLQEPGLTSEQNLDLTESKPQIKQIAGKKVSGSAGKDIIYIYIYIPGAEKGSRVN